MYLFPAEPKCFMCLRVRCQWETWLCDVPLLHPPRLKQRVRLHSHAWVDIFHPLLMTKPLVTHVSLPVIDNGRVYWEASDRPVLWPLALCFFRVGTGWALAPFGMTGTGSVVLLSQIQEWCFTRNLLMNLRSWRLPRIHAGQSPWIYSPSRRKKKVWDEPPDSHVP